MEGVPLSQPPCNLYLMFGSGRLATLIFFNVPFAAVGGIFALALRGMPFSISAAIGFIALFGIAILNGVVMVSTWRSGAKKDWPPPRRRGNRP